MSAWFLGSVLAVAVALLVELVSWRRGVNRRASALAVESVVEVNDAAQKCAAAASGLAARRRLAITRTRTTRRSHPPSPVVR